LWLAGWLGVALDLLAFPEMFSIGARNCQPNPPKAEAHLQVREGRLLQENKGNMRSPKLPPNPKRKIKTIFNHFSNRLARVEELVLAAVRCRVMLSFEIPPWTVSHCLKGVKPSPRSCLRGIHL